MLLLRSHTRSAISRHDPQHEVDVTAREASIAKIRSIIRVPSPFVSVRSPLAFSVAETCRLTRLGRTSIYQAIKSGELSSIQRYCASVAIGSDAQDHKPRHPRR
jgi:hypothetical protein